MQEKILSSLWIIFLYALIPMMAALLGGGVAYFYIPKQKYINILQHFVAGVLVGAVSTELLPKILNQKMNWSIAVGFIIGVALMSFLHEFAHFLARKEKKGMPLGLIAGGAIDFFIDGLLIGISFLAGATSGLIITLSLSLCALFFAFTMSTTLKKRENNKILYFAAIFAMGLMFPLGALLGGGIIKNLPQAIFVETIAFGIAAILYLGIEELLVEAHKTHDTVWVSSAFFLGFLVILLV